MPSDDGFLWDQAMLNRRNNVRVLELLDAAEGRSESRDFQERSL